MPAIAPTRAVRTPQVSPALAASYEPAPSYNDPVHSLTDFFTPSMPYEAPPTTEPVFEPGGGGDFGGGGASDSY